MTNRSTIPETPNKKDGSDFDRFMISPFLYYSFNEPQVGYGTPVVDGSPEAFDVLLQREQNGRRTLKEKRWAWIEKRRFRFEFRNCHALSRNSQKQVILLALVKDRSIVRP